MNYNLIGGRVNGLLGSGLGFGVKTSANNMRSEKVGVLPDFF